MQAPRRHSEPGRSSLARSLASGVESDAVVTAMADVQMCAVKSIPCSL